MEVGEKMFHAEGTCAKKKSLRKCDKFNPAVRMELSLQSGVGQSWRGWRGRYRGKTRQENRDWGTSLVAQ